MSLLFGAGGFFNGNQELNLLLSGRGFLSRIFRPMFRMVSRSWQMFPIGFLFGLGFQADWSNIQAGIQANGRHRHR